MNKPDIPYEIKTECPFLSHPANHQNLSEAFGVITATVTVWQAYGLHLSLGCPMGLQSKIIAWLLSTN